MYHPVYFCAFPKAGDANWITWAAKGGANDVKSIVNASWPACQCLFVRNSLCSQSYPISVPSFLGMCRSKQLLELHQTLFPHPIYGKKRSGYARLATKWTG